MTIASPTDLGPNRQRSRLARWRWTRASSGSAGHGVEPRRAIRRAALVAVLAVTVGLTLVAEPVSARQDDGVVQPGDRFGNNYCTVGPAIGRFVFSPKHCTWIQGSGDAWAEDGAESDVDFSTTQQSQSGDWRYSVVEPAPSTITTWFDCPSIRRSVDDPITAIGCQQSGDDLEFAGVIQPWRGLVISKSGPTTGTTTGTATNSPFDPQIPSSDGTLFVGDLYVCKGDSGSVAYAEIDGAIYLVGMVTGGTGSLAVDQDLKTYADNEKACYRTVDEPNYGHLVSIEHLCRQLPDPERSECLAEAGSPRGELEVRGEGEGRVDISAIGFDPDTAGAGPLETVAVTVDGITVPHRLELRDDAGRFRLSAAEPWGVDAPIAAIGDGAHEICALFPNASGTAGADLRRCAPLSICNGEPADTTVVGTSGADRLISTPGRDLIIGGGGDDVVLGVEANDCYFSGTPAELLAASGPPVSAITDARSQADSSADGDDASGTSGGRSQTGVDDLAVSELCEATTLSTASQERGRSPALRAAARALERALAMIARRCQSAAG